MTDEGCCACLLLLSSLGVSAPTHHLPLPVTGRERVAVKVEESRNEEESTQSLAVSDARGQTCDDRSNDGEGDTLVVNAASSLAS